MVDRIEIPARAGKAYRLAKGQSIKLINTHGHQVVDTWAFNASDLTEVMSMEHTRAKLSSIFPGQGDVLYTNHRRPILTLVEDTSPGIHDTLIAACDTYRYQQLGCTEYHENCHDNLHAAMEELECKIDRVPAPLNMWMNIPVDGKGQVGWEPPVSNAGDYVVLRAEMECIVAFSCCPQDLIPVNAGNPVACHFEVLG